MRKRNIDNPNGLVSIKKILRIINSCLNEKQLKTCELVIFYYTEMAKKKGIVNPDLLYESLFIKLNEKRQELRLINRFKGKIKRRKIKIEEVEKELSENFLN